MPEYKVTVEGKTYTVNIGRIEEDSIDITLDGRTYKVEVEAPLMKTSKTPIIKRHRQVINAGEVPNRTSPPGAHAGIGEVIAPLPGVILKILVKEGDSVDQGQPVATMEAMKMENNIESPIAGTVRKISVSEGDNILENTLIMLIMKIGG